MLDQLRIGNEYSLDGYDASLAGRSISAPKKKEIKETVPFSNKTHDFSKINGELYWEERELQYVFEIIANSPEELEQKKTAFSGWVMNVMNENIYDPYEPGWHYVGTFSDLEYDDEDCVEKTTATVTFMVYPYKLSDIEYYMEYSVAANATRQVTLENKSAHRLMPKVACVGEITITKDNMEYSFPTSIVGKRNIFHLDVGSNSLTIKNKRDRADYVSIIFNEEVF